MTERVHSVTDLQDDYLDCRDLQHGWVYASDIDVKTSRTGRVVGFTRSLRCTRCDTVRRDKYDVEQNVPVLASRSYDYPEYYLMQSPLRAPAVRAELLRRMVPGAKRHLRSA